jgi:hypothetical protein
MGRSARRGAGRPSGVSGMPTFSARPLDRRERRGAARLHHRNEASPGGRSVRAPPAWMHCRFSRPIRAATAAREHPSYRCLPTGRGSRGGRGSSSSSLGGKIYGRAPTTRCQEDCRGPRPEGVGPPRSSGAAARPCLDPVWRALIRSWTMPEPDPCAESPTGVYFPSSLQK